MRVAVLACLVLVSFSGVLSADHHHKEWWKYLEGTWSFENSLGKGEVTFSMASTGDALTANWRNEEKGTSSFEVAGWESDKKVVAVSGYGSQPGNYWHIELDKMSSDMQEGTHHGVLPDGMTYDGKIVIQKIDADHWTWDFAGKNGDGEEYKMGGKLARKAQAIPGRPGRPQLAK